MLGRYRYRNMFKGSGWPKNIRSTTLPIITHGGPVDGVRIFLPQLLNIEEKSKRQYDSNNVFISGVTRSRSGSMHIWIH
jgi:hypothetical protein